MTLKEIAEDMNISPQTLSSYLNGRRGIGFKMANRCAEYLKRSSDWRLFIKMPGPELRALLMAQSN